MYLPEHFAETDATRISEVIAAAPLACIVAQTASGLLANHIPLLSKPDGSLIGHVAKANDMHQTIADGQEVLAIFTSMDAYVSPNFYPSKQEHHRHVPTWNYVTVHVHGTIRFQHDRQAKHAVVGLLTRLHERRVNGDAGWKMGDAPADYMATMLENIVAFRITPTRIEAKSKLSQNREARDYDGAIKGLRASGAHRIADEMARRADGDLPSE
ncbi:FMN-binding negative transcriptional regulator [Natronohydrobacter thiooxidans]|jgi:transcriptional regulator|uniref:FMN-binding negative transcriptional regulator n=1 Tax=Natronohydrobacter thiooxidans TaxID=87172 RepID=UPI0008FF34BD|nr:FMN-binding negative transcriptional regulator [Natronohydrobacter thiooxidans]